MKIGDSDNMPAQFMAGEGGNAARDARPDGAALRLRTAVTAPGPPLRLPGLTVGKHGNAAGYRDTRTALRFSHRPEEPGEADHAPAGLRRGEHGNAARRGDT